MRTTCPFCDESISNSAKICPHCQSDIAAKKVADAMAVIALVLAVLMIARSLAKKFLIPFIRKNPKIWKFQLLWFLIFSIIDSLIFSNAKGVMAQVSVAIYLVGMLAIYFKFRRPNLLWDIVLAGFVGLFAITILATVSRIARNEQSASTSRSAVPSEPPPAAVVAQQPALEPAAVEPNPQPTAQAPVNGMSMPAAEMSPASAAADGSALMLCTTTKHDVVIDKDPASRSLRYRSWNRPRLQSEEPDMQVQPGEIVVEGTGSCRSTTYHFKRGNTEFQVSDNVACVGGRAPDNAIGQLSVLINGEVKSEYWCLR